MTFCSLAAQIRLAHSVAIMRAHGVEIDDIRAVDHDIAPGVQTDMTEHGAAVTTGRLRLDR